MVLASRNGSAATCSNDSGAVHGLRVLAAVLASPLSPRPVNASAQASDVLAPPGVGRHSRFACRQRVDGPGRQGKDETSLNVQKAREAVSGSSDWLPAMGAMHSKDATRRQLLRGTAAIVAATALGISKAVPATSPTKTISHGEFSITVLSDGHLTIPTRFLARNASEADIKTAIGLTGDLVAPPCNVTLVRTPG